MQLLAPHSAHESEVGDAEAVRELERLQDFSRVIWVVRTDVRQQHVGVQARRRRAARARTPEIAGAGRHVFTAESRKV